MERHSAARARRDRSGLQLGQPRGEPLQLGPPRRKRLPQPLGACARACRHRAGALEACAGAPGSAMEGRPECAHERSAWLETLAAPLRVHRLDSCPS